MHLASILHIVRQCHNEYWIRRIGQILGLSSVRSSAVHKIKVKIGLKSTWQVHCYMPDLPVIGKGVLVWNLIQFRN